MIVQYHMTVEGLIQAITATNRTKEQIIEDLQKNFGNVLDLTGGQDESTSST